MEQDTSNRLYNSTIDGNYIGGNLNIVLYHDSEREFVVTHNANIKPTTYFTGRETEIGDLRQRIEEGRKSVLVSGMGGIGKTHICRKLFEEYFNKHANGEDIPFRHIGYIEYSGDMGSSLQNCLKFKQQDSPEQNQEAAWKELEYLASDGKLLLFVDNVDKPLGEDLGLQRLNSIPGAIILTSRQASFSDELELYQIGFLGMEQCKEIYEKIRFKGSRRKIGWEEIQDLEYIIENLAGRHTITIEFLTHLARTKLWSVKQLREKLENNGFRLEFHKNGEYINIQKSYEVLYDLSKLTDAEQNILETFSIFPYIPLAAEICNKWLLADAGVSENDDILAGLYQKGWLQFDIEQESYTMHPVFSQFIYEKCKPKMEEHYGLIEACENSLKIPKNGSVLECQKFIPFAENILKKIDMKESRKQVTLMSILAYLFDYIAEYQKAKKLYERSLEISEKVFGEKHPDTATSYNNLAVVYVRLGEYKKAKKLYERSLEIRECVLGEKHPDTASSYHNLAGVYVRLGEYEKAKKLYERSLEIREEVLGEEHPDTASSYHNLAGVYVRLGEYEKAKKLYERSLEIREEVLGEEHPDTASSYHNLAGVYVRLGEYEKAKKLYERSLEISEKVLGEKHPDTASSYHNLAGVYARLGEYEKAKKLYERSLEIREKVFGEKHPDTASSYNNLAGVYARLEEYEKGLDYYFKAYKIFISKLGLSHESTQIVYENMELAFKEWNPEGDFKQWIEEKMKS